MLVGLAFLTINAVWQLYNTEIPIMLEKMVGDLITHMSPEVQKRFPVTTVVNAIMSVDNVLAIFLLPILGRLSDKTNTRFGKRTPYIIVGVAFAAVSLPFVPLFYGMDSIVGVAIAIAVLLLAMSLYRSPAVALMPDVTPKPLRSKANAVINLMGAAGNVVIVAAAFVVGKIFTDKNSYYGAIFSVTAAIILIVLFVFLATVRENELVSLMPPELSGDDDEEEGSVKGAKMHGSKRRSLIFLLIAVAMWYMAYGAIETNFSRYAVNVLKMDEATKALPMLVAMAAALVCFLPLGHLSGKIGRKKTVILGISVLLGCALISSVVTNIVVLYIMFALIGISWAAINVNSYPMVVEMAKGADIGEYTGIYYTFQMAAQIATPLLSGLLIDLFKGLLGSNNMRILFPYGAVFMLLALIAMIFVQHGDAREVDAVTETASATVNEDDFDDVN